MAKKIVVELVDDLTGEILGEDGKSVEFGLDGKTYRIDLSGDNADKLRELLAPYIAGGQKVSRANRSTSRGVHHSREHLQAVREWAAKNGHQVSDRGRIPQTVMAAFNDAH